MVISFKDIVNSISGVCMSHAQVNQFQYGDLRKDMVENLFNYPLVFLSDGVSKIVGSEMELNFIISVMDKIISSDINELNIISNCLTIGTDIIGELQYKSENYYLDYSFVEMTPFVDKFQDEVGGWMFKVTIKVHEAYNSCDAPFIK